MVSEKDRQSTERRIFPSEVHGLLQMDLSDTDVRLRQGNV